MKPLYTPEQYLLTKSRVGLPFLCYNCQKIFYIKKHYIPRYQRENLGLYCSRVCQHKYLKPQIPVNCSNCQKSFFIPQHHFKRSPKKLFFCNRVCSGTYNAAHKTSGTKRSKLESWLEIQLKQMYPFLDFCFNDNTTLQLELDIYIPSLNLAFELNGIFHYEPIFGINQLNKIQNNDQRKFKGCLEKNIGLCIIDTTSQKYFKEKTSIKFLNIITTIIDQNILERKRNAPDAQMEHRAGTTPA